VVSGRVPSSFYLRLLCNHFRGTRADETKLFIGVDSEDRCDPGSGVRGSCHGEYDGGCEDVRRGRELEYPGYWVLEGFALHHFDSEEVLDHDLVLIEEE
jgi:hypothetical protein